MRKESKIGSKEPEIRLNLSFERDLLKERCTNSVDFNMSSINTEEDQKLALDIASRAFNNKKLLIVAPLLIKGSLDQTSLLKLGKEPQNRQQLNFERGLM